MTLRIPPDAQVSVQQALRDLDARLAKLELTPGTDIDHATVSQLIETAVAGVTPTQTVVLNPNDVMRASGPSHAMGFAPDPGASTGTETVLHEDALWKFPLSGNLVDASDIGQTDAGKRYDLLGSLILNGALIASSARVDDLTVEGTLVSTPYFCRVSNSAAISTTSGSDTAMTFDTETYDPYDMHSLTTNTSRITFPKAGIALIGGTVEFAANATGYRQVYVYKDGATVLPGIQLVMTVTTAAIPTRLSAFSAYVMAANSYVELFAGQNSGGNLNVTSGSDYTPTFWSLLLPTK